MRTAEMLRGTRPIYHLVFLMCLSIGYVHPFPLQVLPSIPGYIPVYIRHGDQPLEDINPAIAEAFHEQSSSSKVDPLTEEERKALETLRIEPKNETQSTSDMYEEAHSSNDLQEEIGSSNAMQEKTQSSNSDSNLNPSNLSNDKPRHQDNKEASNPIVKSDLHLIKDLPQLSTDEGVPPSPLINDESPTAEQRLPTILPNFLKLSPPPEISLQLEMERAENQSLEEKAK